MPQKPTENSPFLPNCLAGQGLYHHIIFVDARALGLKSCYSHHSYFHFLVSVEVALLTGGGSGIGFEIARQFLRHGTLMVR